MKKRRFRGRAAVLALVCLASGAAGAHTDDDGPMTLRASFEEMGSSSGFFDYELVWRLHGSDDDGNSHNKYVSNFFRIEWAATNLGTWRTYANIKGLHVGRVGPVPTQRYYRFRGGGGACYGTRCWRNITSAPMWRPAEACSGSGGGGGGGRIGPD